MSFSFGVVECVNSEAEKHLISGSSRPQPKVFTCYPSGSFSKRTSEIEVDKLLFRMCTKKIMFPNLFGFWPPFLPRFFFWGGDPTMPQGILQGVQCSHWHLCDSADFGEVKFASSCWISWFYHQLRQLYNFFASPQWIVSLKLPWLKIGRPKKEISLPTIHFQVRTVSCKEGSYISDRYGYLWIGHESWPYWCMYFFVDIVSLAQILVGDFLADKTVCHRWQLKDLQKMRNLGRSWIAGRCIGWVVCT